MPEFMMSRFKHSMKKRTKTNDGKTKGNQEPKTSFKLFAVSTPRSSKKGASSDIPVAMETEPSSSKIMTSTKINHGAEIIRRRIEFSGKILNSAQNSLKVLKDMLRGMEEYKNDTSFCDEEVFSEPGSTADFLEEYKEDIPLLDKKVNLYQTGFPKGNNQKPRYPKRTIAKKSYKEEDISSEDEFLYCDLCNKEHKGSCPVHGPMLLVCDKKIPKGCSDRAKQTLPHFLSLGISSIPGAGLGVWTEMPLVAGAVFGPYKGIVMKKNEDAKKSGYAWQVRKHSKPYNYVEGADKSSSNWMRYVNCANHEEWQNVIAFQYLGKIYYRTYKPVLPYTEILVWYGGDYGSELSMLVKETKCLKTPREITGFACDVCNSLFSSSESLERHRKKHPHLKHDKRHRCPECAYSTDSTSNLRRHLFTHNGERPHACPHCSERFTLIGNLRRHLLLHTGQKDHVCSTCGKRFTQKGHLVQHERVHSGEKPYRCPYCGKDFNQSAVLIRHSRLHTRQRPYPCPHCERRFTEKGSLAKHIRSIHTRVFPHNCSVCGKGFNVPGKLKKHVERKHNELGK